MNERHIVIAQITGPSSVVEPLRKAYSLKITEHRPRFAAAFHLLGKPQGQRVRANEEIIPLGN